MHSAGRRIAMAATVVMMLGLTVPLAHPSHLESVGSWRSMSLTGAPASRTGQSAVWTGTEMIIWGGAGGDGSTLLGDGAAYDPASDSWRQLSPNGAPSPRFNHIAAWTGHEMIVWGGQGPGAQGSGGIYDPARDTWASIANTGSPMPSSGGNGELGVWTGKELIVWGGCCPPTNTGAAYDPDTDSWRPLSTGGAPRARLGAAAVWTGLEMLVWGGLGTDASGSQVVLGDGGRYHAIADTWKGLSTQGSLSPRAGHVVGWTGREMLIWGGGEQSGQVIGDGARYDPAADRWARIGTSAGPSRRQGETAVWTGTEWLLWGGSKVESGPGQPTRVAYAVDDLRYNPATDSWAAISQRDAPMPRSRHTAVWTGREMLVWGGITGELSPDVVRLGDGGRYTPPDHESPQEISQS